MNSFFNRRKEEKEDPPENYKNYQNRYKEKN
jgi:hypothetical protein